MTKNDLVFKAVEGVDFYMDNNDYDKLYAEFQNFAGKTEFASLDSEAFKSHLFMKMDEVCDDDVGLDPNGAVKRIRWILSYQKNYQQTEVFVRNAGDLKHSIEYDLQNNNQETVKITSEGWEVSAKEKKFIRSSVNLSQVTPIQTEKTPLELLGPLVNLTGDFLILFVVWIIQAFSTGKHHAMLVFAEHGSGKSTLSKMVKQIVDPCKFSVTTIPSKTDDLHTILYNTSLVCFDNVSTISHEVSDIFCGAVTGTAIPKRSLYTNNGLNVTTIRNTILINGIGVVPERDDLAERMLFLNLKKLTSKNLKPETEVWKDFEKALPEILGSIFNALSKAMTEIKSIEETDLPRMADSFIEMLAIAKALGISEEEFRRIYNQNKEELDQVRQGTPLVTAVKEYMETFTGRKYTGKADMVYQEIHKNFSGNKALLPKSASHFSRKLESEYSNLANAGFRVNIDDTSAKGTEISIIKKK